MEVSGNNKYGINREDRLTLTILTQMRHKMDRTLKERGISSKKSMINNLLFKEEKKKM